MKLANAFVIQGLMARAVVMKASRASIVTDVRAAFLAVNVTSNAHQNRLAVRRADVNRTVSVSVLIRMVELPARLVILAILESTVTRPVIGRLPAMVRAVVMAIHPVNVKAASLATIAPPVHLTRRGKTVKQRATQVQPVLDTVDAREMERARVFIISQAVTAVIVDSGGLVMDATLRPTRAMDMAEVLQMVHVNAMADL